MSYYRVGDQILYTTTRYPREQVHYTYEIKGIRTPNLSDREVYDLKILNCSDTNNLSGPNTLTLNTMFVDNSNKFNLLSRAVKSNNSREDWI